MPKPHEWAVMALLLLVGGSFVKRRGQHVPPAVVKWSDHDMRAFLEETRGLVPPEIALAVYTAESGLDPKASSGIAFGIPQMTGQTLKAIGWTRPAKEFATLTVANQAPWIARLQAMQIRTLGRPKTGLDLYVQNFCPRAWAKNEDVLYRSPSEAYARNAGLDRDRKGYIVRQDLVPLLERATKTETYRRALEQAKRLGPAIAELPQ